MPSPTTPTLSPISRPSQAQGPLAPEDCLDLGKTPNALHLDENFLDLGLGARARAVNTMAVTAAVSTSVTVILSLTLPPNPRGCDSGSAVSVCIHHQEPFGAPHEVHATQ